LVLAASPDTLGTRTGALTTRYTYDLRNRLTENTISKGPDYMLWDKQGYKAEQIRSNGLATNPYALRKK